ncbi:MAG TPA: hypothetical protein VH092_01290 [Urbifossiella sp.]|nr:hypothetical protein [Urbifossiella sp.]
MDEQEACWLASIHLRDRLGAAAAEWEQLPGVEPRVMGWVVSFRHTGHFKPGDGPRPLSFYVFRDSWVEVISKHGPRFHESRHQRFESRGPAEPRAAADRGLDSE